MVVCEAVPITNIDTIWGYLTSYLDWGSDAGWTADEILDDLQKPISTLHPCYEGATPVGFLVITWQENTAFVVIAQSFTGGVISPSDSFDWENRNVWSNPSWLDDGMAVNRIPQALMAASVVEHEPIPTEWSSRAELKQFAQERYGITLDARMTIPNMLADLDVQLSNQ